jgi:hypothetical protein
VGGAPVFQHGTAPVRRITRHGGENSARVVLEPGRGLRGRARL